MKLIEKKHRQVEAKMTSMFGSLTPKQLTTQEEIIELINSDQSIEDLFTFANVFSKKLEMTFGITIHKAAYEFSCHYHNTIINMAKNWFEWSHDKNVRIVLGTTDHFKIELKQSAAGEVELWHIDVFNKNQGIGTRVIDLFMDTAEQLNFVVKLVPCSQGEPSYEDFFKKTIKLRQWYQDLGFETVKNSAYLTF